MPFFSVIIPTYNRHEHIRNAVQSVLKQTFTDYEIIVIDDGSTDETHLIAEEFQGSITYIRQENRGVSAARNAGIAIASSPYIALLDSDDEWLPQKLHEQKKFIGVHPDILIHQTEEIWIRSGRRVNPGKRHTKVSGKIFIESLDLCLISPSAAVLHRDLFDRFGLFDESMPACEDYDLWLRITSAEEVGLITSPLIFKNGGHADQLSRSFWGMDRFRVYSILKFIISAARSSPTNPDSHKASYKTIPSEYLMSARDVAIKKCRILSEGGKKRGNVDFASELDDIIQQLIDENYNKINYQILLKQ